MNELLIGNHYLVYLNGVLLPKIAKFEGFDKYLNWQGTSGEPKDTWNHRHVKCYLSLSSLNLTINNNTKEVTGVLLRKIDEV